mgnify:CR=1 FL=1
MLLKLGCWGWDHFLHITMSYSFCKEGLHLICSKNPQWCNTTIKIHNIQMNTLWFQISTVIPWMRFPSSWHFLFVTFKQKDDNIGVRVFRYIRWPNLAPSCYSLSNNDIEIIMNIRRPWLWRHLKLSLSQKIYQQCIVRTPSLYQDLGLW